MANLTVSKILSETISGFKRLGVRAYMWTVVLIVAGIISDLAPMDYSMPLIVGFTIISLFAQSDIIRTDLADAYLLPTELRAKPKIGPLFFVGVLYSLGVIFGAILLILPGIFIAVRWWLASPTLYAEDVHATEAIGRSWDITKEHLQPILAAVIALALPFFAALAGYLYATDDYGNIGLLHSIPINIMTSFATIAFWLSSSTTYSLIKGDAKRLNQIFE